MYNPYSRCACCDQTLTSRQPTVYTTGKVDDLCGGCRRIVNRAVHYHEDDVIDMKTEVWCRQMGGIEEMFEGSRSSELGYDENDCE